MKIEYFPQLGFQIGSHSLKWLEARADIRQLLNDQHQCDDHTIDLSMAYDGDTSHNVNVKRDIYENWGDEQFSFFLNYDAEDRLKEIEFHVWGNIVTNKIQFQKGQDIRLVFNHLKELDPEARELEEGMFFSNKLAILVASDNALGGDGNGLGYFYAGLDVTHLP